jgi:carbonic anhydrase/acetyltransferase-like protein (isoleucine patch superfamily)
MRFRLGDRRVELRGANHFIAHNATVVGSVILGDATSVWFNAVIRGDNDTIALGARTNVQDAAVLHTDPGIALSIGEGVSIGHQAMLHGCTVGDGCLIGIKAVVLNHAVIGRDCLIGANALIAEGKTIPERSLVVGSPGRVVRALTDEEVARVRGAADIYVRHARNYLRQFEADPRA